MCVCCIVSGPGLLRILITVGQPGLKREASSKKYSVKGAGVTSSLADAPLLTERQRDVRSFVREVDHHRSRRRVRAPGATDRAPGASAVRSPLAGAHPHAA